MGEKEKSGFDNFPRQESRLGGLSKAKVALFIAFRLLLCPGDDIALAFIQADSSQNPNIPVAALLYDPPEITKASSSKDAPQKILI